MKVVDGFVKLTNEEFDQWVAALRSGEYRQGMHRLVARDGAGDAYCCMGVLGKVLNRLTIMDEGVRCNFPGSHHDASSVYISVPHFEPLGCRNDGSLSTMHNPSGRVFNFKEQADWLEERRAEFVYIE